MVQVVLSSKLKFRTRENCLFYFRNMLADYKIGDLISCPDAEDLTALTEHHVNAKNLVGAGIAYFQKAKTSRMNHFGEFVIVRIDNTAVALSHSEAALGANFKLGTKPKNKGFMERPIGLADGIVWIQCEFLS